MNVANEKVATLRSQDEIRESLKEVDPDEYTQQRIHPHFIKMGGRQLVASGIVLGLNLAISDASQGFPPSIAALLQMNIPQYIDCLTDDEEVRVEAKQMWAEVQKKIAGG